MAATPARRATRLTSQLAIVRALVLRPMLREKTRTLLTILGIAVGVAVIVAIQLANQSALRAFRESVDAIAGRANYQLVPDVAPLDEQVLFRLRPVWNTGGRFAPVIDVDGIIEPSQQPVRLLGVDLLSDLHFRDYRYARIMVGEGASPVTIQRYLQLFREDSAVVPVPFAREQRLEVGSPVTLNIRGHRKRLIVRGLLDTVGPAKAFNGSIVICDIATAQRSFGMAGQLSRVDLMLPEARAAAAIREIGLPPGVRIERPSRRNERVERMLRAFRVNLFALAGVALLVGVFLVYNTVLISILRRRKDVGVLKTVGTSPAQIFVAFLTEGLAFGAAGSLLGVALGHALATAILEVVGRTINTLYVASEPADVALTPAIVITGLATGLVLSLVSAVQPALEASRLRPSTMIRPGLHQRVEHLPALGLASVLCFAGGALASQIPPAGGIAVGGYVSVLFVVAGFSLLAPAIVRTTSAAVAPPLQRLFGVVGRLASVSLPASLRRTAVASAALSLATGMMVAVALMVGSFRETVRIWVDQTVSSDLWLRPAKGLTNADAALFRPEVAEALRKVPFVSAIDRVRGKDVVFRDSLIAVGSGDLAVAASRGELPMVRPSSHRRALLEAVRLNGVVVSESFSLKFDLGVGDTVELPTAKGVGAFPITGIYRDYSSDRGTVVMDRPLFVRSFQDDAINTIVVYLTAGTDLETARLELQRTFGPRFGAFVVTNREIRREVMTIFDQTFMITYALLGVAIVVAVLGIVNTLSALILERSRELALLRAGGLSANELTLMLVLESAILGIASTVVGLVMGYVLSWILINVINKQSFGWTIDFYTPAALIATSLFVTFCAAVLAGLAPARLARRIDIASALKTE